MVFFERCRGLNGMKHSAIVADTSRIGCKADVAAAAVGIAAAVEERGLPPTVVVSRFRRRSSFIDDCNFYNKITV